MMFSPKQWLAIFLVLGLVADARLAAAATPPAPQPQSCQARISLEALAEPTATVKAVPSGAQRVTRAICTMAFAVAIPLFVSLGVSSAQTSTPKASITQVAPPLPTLDQAQQLFLDWDDKSARLARAMNRSLPPGGGTMSPPTRQEIELQNQTDVAWVTLLDAFKALLQQDAEGLEGWNVGGKKIPLREIKDALKSSKKSVIVQDRAGVDIVKSVAKTDLEQKADLALLKLIAQKEKDWKSRKLAWWLMFSPLVGVVLSFNRRQFNRIAGLGSVGLLAAGPTTQFYPRRLQYIPFEEYKPSAMKNPMTRGAVIWLGRLAVEMRAIFDNTMAGPGSEQRQKYLSLQQSTLERLFSIPGLRAEFERLNGGPFPSSLEEQWDRVIYVVAPRFLALRGVYFVANLVPLPIEKQNLLKDLELLQNFGLYRVDRIVKRVKVDSWSGQDIRDELYLGDPLPGPRNIPLVTYPLQVGATAGYGYIAHVLTNVQNTAAAMYEDLSRKRSQAKAIRDLQWDPARSPQYDPFTFSIYKVNGLAMESLSSAQDLTDWIQAQNRLHENQHLRDFASGRYPAGDIPVISPKTYQPFIQNEREREFDGFLAELRFSKPKVMHREFARLGNAFLGGGMSVDHRIAIFNLFDLLIEEIVVHPTKYRSVMTLRPGAEPLRAQVARQLYLLVPDPSQPPNPQRDKLILDALDAVHVARLERRKQLVVPQTLTSKELYREHTPISRPRNSKRAEALRREV